MYQEELNYVIEVNLTQENLDYLNKTKGEEVVSLRLNEVLDAYRRLEIAQRRVRYASGNQKKHL